ncbi:hypothetical protein N5863_29010 (plasmid) [Klebsiella pasteurii]|uniref:hypothetical protein n=1 Tax=Klebsiella pasteurii TaxID=2587529 RepID=UPI00254304D9|nr:hypothetical protein [Klebsiella pasteurii]WII85135.1 hypothetical protein N5863_29010 [Klebsiella pasteurii]
MYIHYNKLRKYLKNSINSKKPHSSIAIIIFLICVVVIVELYFISNISGNRTPMVNFSCTSKLIYESSKTNEAMNANILFLLRADGEGVIIFDGEVNDKEGDYKLSRKINFRYEYFSSRFFIIKEESLVLSKKDTIPNGFFEEKYFPAHAFYITPIKGINNALLIGNSISPVFICVNDDGIKPEIKRR